MFDDILGQPAALGMIRRALETGRVHHAYRFEGPSGVGKEKAAFLLARALVCSTPPPAGFAFWACGHCSACTRATSFSAERPCVPLHPDVVLIERGLYPPEVLRRQRPEVSEISVDQIRRVVLEHASFPPHEGRSRVFLVRRAHELSTSAANALLKTLEEPVASTYFILLTDRSSELLSTIRSRTLPVRFSPLPDAIVQSILTKHGIDEKSRESATELAGGSADLALELAQPAQSAERIAFVDAVLSALNAPDLTGAVGLGEARSRDRHALLAGLAALGAQFARDGRRAAAKDPREASRCAGRYQVVSKAMHEIDRNGSPALVLEAMVERLRLGL